MLEIERKLGRHLAGRTTKAASLLRIADFLVSRNIVEAVPEQENVIIAGRPTTEWLKSALAATAVLLLLLSGAALYHSRVKASKEPLPLQTVVPERQLMATSLATRPLVTTAITPTAPVTTPPQDTPVSSLSVTRPAPLPSLAGFPVNTVLSAPSSSPNAIEPEKKHASPAEKKANSVKKKKIKVRPGQ
jgi:hypothetical protein